jgi:sulfite exporter TauE/SafE
MVYAVGAKAAATGEPLSAVLIMAAFGLGTFLPLVFATTVAKGLAGVRVKGFTYLTSLMIIALGVKSMYMSFVGM